MALIVCVMTDTPRPTAWYKAMLAPLKGLSHIAVAVGRSYRAALPLSRALYELPFRTANKWSVGSPSDRHFRALIHNWAENRQL